MSRSVNRVTLVGNAGSDPDVRRTANGTTVAHVSLATNRLYQQNGQDQQRTDWHRLTFWGKAAETIEQYLRKGNRLYVEGRLEYGSFDREGITIPTADIVVNTFVFLDGRNGAPEESVEQDPAEAVFA